MTWWTFLILMHLYDRAWCVYRRVSNSILVRLAFVDAWWRLVTRPIFVLPTPKIQVLCIESKYVAWVLVIPQNSIVCIIVSCYEISIQRAVALIGCISLHRCVLLWRNVRQSIGSQFLKTVKRISIERSSAYSVYEIYIRRFHLNSQYTIRIFL